MGPGALTAWQTVPVTLATIDEHDLFETELFKPFKPLVDIAGGDPAVAQSLAYSLRCQINVGLLGAVDTVTWRSPHAMLSTAQDYRPGCFGQQYHAWQATLDEDAVVFTTLPGNEPRPGTRWVDADLYWSGTGAMPRSAQVGDTAVHLYAPRFASPGPGPLEAFSYLPFTHAYFPTERFDEVRQVGNWTLGRRGDGYVALWSWRPTQWRTHDPAVTFTNGLTQPFDLVAPGGADNAWVVQVGDAGEWQSFSAFADAVTSAPLSVAARPPGADGLPGGFDVTYQSPTAGPDHLLVHRSADGRRHGGPTARHGPLVQPVRRRGGGRPADRTAGRSGRPVARHHPLDPRGGAAAPARLTARVSSLPVRRRR